MNGPKPDEVILRGPLAYPPELETQCILDIKLIGIDVSSTGQILTLHVSLPLLSDQSEALAYRVLGQILDPESKTVSFKSNRGQE